MLHYNSGEWKSFSLVHLLDISNFHLYFIGGVVYSIIYMKYCFYVSCYVMDFIIILDLPLFLVCLGLVKNIIYCLIHHTWRR